MDIWYFLKIFSPVLVCVKKNLATLLLCGDVPKTFSLNNATKTTFGLHCNKKMIEIICT
jgi:hypothetical protein